ncbi:unnamed protein product [Cochlearia groenlandica]
MKQVVVFMLIITMSYTLNEACKKNHIVIHNQLAPGKLLQYQCRRNIGNVLHNVETVNFNTFKIVEFEDKFTSKGRTVWRCVLRHGPKMEYFYDIIVYRAASYPRCGQLRSWIARNDGIWFTKDYHKPPGPVLKWEKHT